MRRKTTWAMRRTPAMRETVFRHSTDCTGKCRGQASAQCVLELPPCSQEKTLVALGFARGAGPQEEIYPLTTLPPGWTHGPHHKSDYGAGWDVRPIYDEKGRLRAQSYEHEDMAAIDDGISPYLELTTRYYYEYNREEKQYILFDRQTGKRLADLGSVNAAECADAMLARFPDFRNPLAYWD